MMTKVLITTVALLASTISAQSKSFSTKNLTVFSDFGWKGVRLYDNCNMRKKVGLDERVVKGKIDGEKVLRFSLNNGDVGACGSDKKPRNGAPFWERSELKQTKSLKPDTKYELTFNARFVEGFGGMKETFWQLHSWDKTCKSGPPMRFMFNKGKLSMQPFIGDGYKAPAHTAFDISEFTGEWREFRIEFGTGTDNHMKLYIDGTFAVETPFNMKECGVPHMKFGIYRPGAQDGKSNQRSVVDFSRIKLKVVK
jgi:hypothetical protein